MSSTPEEPIPNPPISAHEQAAADLLSAQDLEVIDAKILSHCADRFHKVAWVVGRTVTDLRGRYPQLSYIYYTLRLKHLVDTGHLESAGNVLIMRFSEVRLADKRPDPN